jgi:Heterokaryon incompatibility protein (HET)
MPLPIGRLDEYEFHVVDSDGKKLIFSKYLPSQAAQERMGQDIYLRLKQLAPSVAMHFEAKRDPLEKLTFCLWTQCEAEYMCEDAYIALSYCWGAARYPPQPGLQYPLPISPLMFAALAQECQWRTTDVWIDQVCIDQGNEAEKSVSVAEMDAVYRCAQFVIVALIDIEVPLRQ